ncbi:sensor histidine kinase, partial [Methylobacterium sp. WL122]
GQAQGGTVGAGLGLGLFIAKTLIERSGAQITLSNASAPGTHGAQVRISWARHIFERGAALRHAPEFGTRPPLPAGDVAPI